METKFTIVEIGVPLISFILAFVFITIVIAKKFIKTKISEYGRRHVALRDIQKDFRNTVSDNQNKIDQLSSESAAISNTIQSLRSEIFNHEEEINSLSLEKRHISDDVKQRRPMYEQLMKDLKDLETRRDTLKKDNKELLFQIENKGKLESDVSFLKERRGKLDSESRALKIEISDVRKKLKELISELDLYSQQDEFANQGHYEMPEYLYESSERYKHEIKRERETQKSLISSGRAVLNLPNGNSDTDQQLVIPQSKLLLRTFNIECDLLFGKIKHSNYARTITRVESLANSLEKQLTDLNVGFNLEFIKSKLKECTLIYHEKLKAKEEQEKQKLHRAELAEEAKAQREYKAALKKAQLEEETYNNLLEQARAELLETSQENMAEQQDRIKYLEQKLSEAKDQPCVST